MDYSKFKDAKFRQFMQEKFSKEEQDTFSLWYVKLLAVAFEAGRKAQKEDK